MLNIFSVNFFQVYFWNSLGRTVLHIRLYDRWENVSYGGLTFSIVYCPLLILVRTFLFQKGVKFTSVAPIFLHFHFLFKMRLLITLMFHLFVQNLLEGEKRNFCWKSTKYYTSNTLYCTLYLWLPPLLCGVDKLFQSMYVWQVTNIPQNHPSA